MKQMIALTLALMSLSAFSATEFFSKNLNQDCVISKNKVTVTTNLVKGTAGFTTTKTIETFGLDKLVAKAVEASTGKPTMEGYVFTVSVDGEKSTLHYDDSREAASLIQFVQKACYN